MAMSPSRSRSVTRKWPLVLLAVTVVVALCLFAGPPIVRRAAALFYERSMGNKEHFLGCADLPAVEDVEQALLAHQDVIERLEQVNSGHIVIYADRSRCPGKADIVILFATLEDSLAIRRIIGGDIFFGVPYRMYNS
jgi:hypothetical protein